MAAEIAGANPMKTTLTAMRLGTLLYIIPFVFVLEPALILRGPWQDIILQTTTFAIGAIFIAFASEGMMYGVGELSIPYRLLSLLAGLSLVFPGWILTISGLILASVSLLPYWRKKFHRTSTTVSGGN